MTDIYYISVEELCMAFMSLPANLDKGLRVIGLGIILPTGDGQLSKYRLFFDWNETYNDWELSPAQPLVITASNRFCSTHPTNCEYTFQ